MKVKCDINCAVLYNNKVFFFLEEYNGLYSVDLKTKEIVCHGAIPWEDTVCYRLIESMVIYDDHIYMIPFNGGYLSVFNLKTNSYEKKIDIRKGKTEGAFAASFIRNEILYIFGCTARTIVRYDIKKDCVYQWDEWLDEAKAFIFDEQDAFFKSQGIIEEDRFIIPFCNANAVLALYDNNMKFNIIEIGNGRNGYSGIMKKEDKYYLCPRKEKMNIVVCDDSFNTIKALATNFVKEKGVYYGGCAAVKDKVIFFGAQENIHLNEYDPDETMTVMIGTKLLYYLDGKSVYYNIKEGKLFVAEENGNEFCEDIRITVDKSIINKKLTSCVHVEKHSMTLEMFLDSI